jgi:hypothetical protein
MKKLILLFAIFFSFLLTKAQEELFEGITSGISKSDYISYCIEKDNIDITVERTTLYFHNIPYTMQPKFNHIGDLEGLVLEARIDYNDETYDTLKNNIIEINNYFKDKCGKEVDVIFSNSSPIQNLIYSISFRYNKESLTCLTYISESINEFRVFVFIKDYDTYNK